MNTLVSISQLASLLGQPGLLIFDCRFSLMDTDAGRKAWQQSHIPGAHYADMNRQLSTPHIPGITGRHPLPAKADWLKQMQAWGLSPDIQVVAYDDAGGASAARLWWLLRWAGHDKTAVLDGGWQAWLAQGLPVTPDVPVGLPHSNFDYGTMPPLATLIQVDELNGDRQLLLDAREPARFRGEVEPIDPVAGHIPGALCSPFSANLRPDGTFKSREDLQQKFAVAAATARPVVCYCGSGVTACHNILAMVVAGLPMPALYPGSWSEWIVDPLRPVAVEK